MLRQEFQDRSGTGNASGIQNGRVQVFGAVFQKKPDLLDIV